MERGRSLSQSLPLIAMLAGGLLMLSASLPAGWLPIPVNLLARVALAKLGFLHAFDVTFIYDSLGYVDYDFSKGVLDNFRTFGYPLFLKAVAWLSADYQWLPFAQNLLHVVAVLVFWHGLRRVGFSGWAAAITAFPLYFARTIEGYGHWVMADAPALSLALATLGLTLVVVGQPLLSGHAAGKREPARQECLAYGRRTVWWIALAVVLFLSYMTRPAYLFLIGLVPVVGALVAWLLRLAAPELRRVVIGLTASSLVPFLLFSALRGWVVGHFGVVSAGGVNAIGIAAEMLDPKLCQRLPHHLRPMALRIHQERDVFFPRRHITRRWIDMTVPEDWFNYNVHCVSHPLTVAFCSTNALEVVNGRLAEFSAAVFRQAPATYGLWIAFSFAHDAMGIWRWLRWELLCLAGLSVVAGALCWMSRAKSGKRGLQRLIPSGPAWRETGIILLVALGFYGTGLLLVAMVEDPLPRYTDACHLFLPSLIACGFVAVARSLGNSVRALRGPATCEIITSPDAAPPDQQAAQDRAGRYRKALGWLALCSVVAVSGWLGWRVLGGGLAGMDRFLDAVQRGDSAEVTKMLELDPGWARRSSAEGVCGLHVAAMDGQRALAELLLRRGADVGAADRDGLTPLHWAAVAGQAAVMDDLLARGADPNAASKDGIRPIHLARTAAEVNALTQHGARPDVADKRGLGPLHWVLDLDAATALVKAGADPNKPQRDSAGARVVPALQHAIRKFNGPLGKRLLELGADPNLRDAQGQTALFASLGALRTLLDELLAYRANPSLAVDVGSMSKWRLRVAGVTGFVDPEDDMTVLHWATLLDHPETVKKLAAAARDVNIKSRLGLTPLHWAAAANKAQAVVALLACGADPSLKNNAGQTAADLAAKGGHAWIVQALRDAKRRAETDAHGRGHPNDTIRTDR